MGKTVKRKPDWIKFTVPGGKEYTTLKGILSRRNLHTVCTEARCPNMGECFADGTATFLVLGDICTRACRYCAVQSGVPGPVDIDEPENCSAAAKEMGLKHVVVTSVTRDDLQDGGASHFAAIVKNLREIMPECTIELLVPDFGTAAHTSLEIIIAAAPDVINHNIEVVRPLYHTLRPQGNYELSLSILTRAAASGIHTKSGLMIGFGETLEDITDTLKELVQTGCRTITIGQYLQSKRGGYRVEKYYTPLEFREIEACARERGFSQVLAGPLVRSSYHAAELCKG